MKSELEANTEYLLGQDALEDRPWQLWVEVRSTTINTNQGAALFTQPSGVLPVREDLIVSRAFTFGAKVLDVGESGVLADLPALFDGNSKVTYRRQILQANSTPPRIKKLNATRDGIILGMASSVNVYRARVVKKNVDPLLISGRLEYWLKLDTGEWLSVSPYMIEESPTQGLYWVLILRKNEG